MAPSSPGCRPPAPVAESGAPSADLRSCRRSAYFGCFSCVFDSMEQSLCLEKLCSMADQIKTNV